jgi:transcriptional regulator with XRE-family HTH domain
VNAFQARLARLALNLKFTDAAKLCDVAVETIRRIEIADSTVKEKTIEKVRAAFEKAGVEFIAADDGGPGVRLRKVMKGRKSK